jgi:hypothetical protein
MCIRRGVYGVGDGDGDGEVGSLTVALLAKEEEVEVEGLEGQEQGQRQGRWTHDTTLVHV